MKNERIKFKVSHVVMLLIGTFIFSLAIFNLGSFCCHYAISSSTLNNFGTFYGGILGPVIACFGLFYIYQTFDIQEKQFDIVKKDADFNIINRLYDNLIQEINSIQFRRKGEVFNGVDALYNFDSSHWGNPNGVLNHLQSILVSFEHILKMANDEIRYKYTVQKRMFVTRIYFLYYEKIIWPVYQNIYDKEMESLLANQHPGFDKLIAKYEHLTVETYKYLIKEGHIEMPKEEKLKALIKREPHPPHQ